MNDKNLFLKVWRLRRLRRNTVRVVCDETLFLGSQTVLFTDVPLTWQMEKTTVTNPSWCNNIPLNYPPNMINLNIMISTHKIWGMPTFKSQFLGDIQSLWFQNLVKHILNYRNKIFKYLCVYVFNELISWKPDFRDGETEISSIGWFNP